LQAEVFISGKARNRKYKVVTVPEMDQIHKDVFGVIKNLHDSGKALRRCDAMIFPLLELPSNYIPQPDMKTNPRITFILKLVDKLLDSCTYHCRKKVLNF